MDQRPVLAGIFTSLKKGGRVLVQMGGKGNAQEVISVFNKMVIKDPWKRYFHDFTFPYGFYGPDEYEPWLTQSGFVINQLELIPKEMIHDSVEQFKGWIRTTWLPYLNRVPDSNQEMFIDQLIHEYLTVTGQLDNSTVMTKMIRLEFSACKEG